MIYTHAVLRIPHCHRSEQTALAAPPRNLRTPLGFAGSPPTSRDVSSSNNTYLPARCPGCTERYVPWRRISSWRCLGCGLCCGRYRAQLRTIEYARLLERFGSWCIDLSTVGRPSLRRIAGRCIFQDVSGGCGLQPLGMKPAACKLWPFLVYGRGRASKRRPDALLEHRGERYYVYVNIWCSGVNAGDPRELEPTVREVAEIWSRPSRGQVYSTFRPSGSGAIPAGIRGRRSPGDERLVRETFPDVRGRGVPDPLRRAGRGALDVGGLLQVQDPSGVAMDLRKAEGSLEGMLPHRSLAEAQRSAERQRGCLAHLGHRLLSGKDRS